MNITIPVNRKRFPVVFVVGLILTIAIVSFIYHSIDTDTNVIVNVFYGVMILIPCLFYTFTSLVEYIKTIFDKNAKLQISETGMYDNLSIFSCGEISWSDIESVKIIHALNAKFLIIKVKDPQNFLTGKNFIKKYVFKRWIKKWGTPVVISEKRINYNLNNLKDTILELAK